VNDGLTDFSITALAVGGTNIYAGTGSTGVWRRPLAEMAAGVHQPDATNVPNEAVLEQNYPNPFSERTTIEYAVPKTGRASLDVYNILGMKILSLAGGGQSPGRHRVILDAHELERGIYWYRLSASGVVRNREMIIVR
jgi:hypothetical protein